MDAKLLPYLTPTERGWLALDEAATPIRGIAIVPNSGYEETP